VEKNDAGLWGVENHPLGLRSAAVTMAQVDFRFAFCSTVRQRDVILPSCSIGLISKANC